MKKDYKISCSPFLLLSINITYLGEPAFGALANALHQATGKRFYHQPFLGNERVLG